VINEAERQRFIDWTFGRELTLLEDLMDDFDRNSPPANPDQAHNAALLTDKDRFPRLLGYDLHRLRPALVGRIVSQRDDAEGWQLVHLACSIISVSEMPSWPGSITRLYG
jgi:hypothetical protein